MDIVVLVKGLTIGDLITMEANVFIAVIIHPLAVVLIMKKDAPMAMFTGMILAETEKIRLKIANPSITATLEETYMNIALAEMCGESMILPSKAVPVEAVILAGITTLVVMRN
jgi:hypothetical protein